MRASYSRDFPSIQLNNVDFAGFNAPGAAGPAVFPFGGFARDADVLQVPFIGGYRVRRLDGNPLNDNVLAELNSVTIDSSFAEDGLRMQTRQDAAEVIAAGRVNRTETIGHFVSAHPEGAFGTQQSSGLGTYGWANDILDYFEALSPSEGAFAVDPDARQIDPDDERLRAVHGRVNINTAPWYVLAQLPLVVDPATGATDRARTYELAKMIARRRIPITLPPESPYYSSLLDLQKLVLGGGGQPQQDAFMTAMGTITPAGPDPGDGAGDFSPFGTGEDGIGSYVVPRGGTPAYNEEYELERRHLNLTRLSNLLTVRSDAFTVYLVVEGWSDAYTPDAKRVVQRRVAFIIDRSAVTEFNKKPRIYNIPTQ